jgi:hypothetical protein
LNQAIQVDLDAITVAVSMKDICHPHSERPSKDKCCDTRHRSGLRALQVEVEAPSPNVARMHAIAQNTSIECLARTFRVNICILYLPAIFLRSSSFGGSQYSQMATNTTNPTTTLQSPATQTHPPVILQLLGHSSCAKCRTVTCLFSSTFVRNGRL